MLLAVTGFTLYSGFRLFSKPTQIHDQKPQDASGKLEETIQSLKSTKDKKKGNEKERKYKIRRFLFKQKHGKMLKNDYSTLSMFAHLRC